MFSLARGSASVEGTEGWRLLESGVNESSSKQTAIEKSDKPQGIQGKTSVVTAAVNEARSSAA